MSANTTNIKAAATNKTRRFNWPRIFGYDFFISFKLGPPPIGAQSYASDLARRLRELDFTVFFSEEEAPPGEKLDTTLVKALHRSRILLVIANEGALVRSHWVRKEVEEFRSRHPKRSIIPINIDRTIEEHGLRVEADKWLDHEGRIWLDETAQAVKEGIANPEVLRRLVLTPRFIRANRLFRGSVAIIMAVIMGLGGYAWFKKRESYNRFVAYNISQGRVALTNGRGLEAAPSLLRAFKEGVDTAALRFMVARAFTSLDALIASFAGNGLAFSSDGTQFAVAFADGTVQVWSVPERKIVMTLPEKMPGARTLLFSPDGKRLAITTQERSGTEGSQATSLENENCRIGERGSHMFVTYWDIQSGTLLHKFEPFDNDWDCWQAFFSDNGRTLTLAGWTTQWTDLYWSLTKFDITTGSALSATKPDDQGRCREFPRDDVLQMMNREGTGNCPGKVVAISADGALIALAPWDVPARKLIVWDVRQGTEFALPFGYDTEVIGAAFSLDNERIAITQVGGIEVWDVRARRKGLSVPVGALRIPVEFSPDGSRLVAITAQRSVAVFDAGNGHRTTLIDGHAAQIRVATFSPEGEHILTVGDDGVAKIWDAWTGQLLITLEGHREPILSASFSPNRQLLVTKDQGGNIKLWHGRPITMPSILREDPAHLRWWSESQFELTDWSADGEQVLLTYKDLWARSDTSQQVFTLWQTRTGFLTGLWKTAEPPVLRSDNTTATTASPPVPCLSEPNGAEPEAPLAVDHAANRIVVKGRGAEARRALLLAKSERCKPLPLVGHHAEIKVAAFSPDDQFVQTADEAGVIMIWDAVTADVLAVLAGEEHPQSVSFLPNGGLLTLHDRNTAVYWDVALEQRSVAELERILACSGSVPHEMRADLVSGSPPECLPGIHLPEPLEPMTSRNAAHALFVSGWARRNDRSWAEQQLQTASLLSHERGDMFQEALGHLALRAITRAAGDTVQAETEAKVVQDLMLRLNRVQDQQVRLTRLGELAFNEFGDGDLARFAFSHALARAPQDQAAKLGAWEASPSISRPTDWLNEVSPEERSHWSSSQRALAITWVATFLADQNTKDASYVVWNMYVGTTIDPVFERLDFRGLRREISGARFPQAKQKHVLSVLEQLEQPGDHGNELKDLLGIPKEESTVGP